MAEQLCGDGRDDDCNGTRDCADTACNGIPCASGGKVCANEACACPTGNAESSCTNNADDNCDGLVDCDDDGCTGQVCGANGRTCAGRLCLCAGGDVETSCGDGLDNDCDGLFDCDDADCERLECNDGNACTDQETCNAGVCGDGAPRSCTAGTCEVSVCNPTTGECDRSPALAGTACNDENACTVQDQCDEVGLCTGGAPRGCDDSNPCTVNDCQPASGCDFSRPVDGTPACGPGDEGVCRTGVCIAAREISCTDGVDNDQDGLIDCMDLADCGNVACEDGRGFCTSGEVCQPDGSCGGGTEVLCALPPPGGCFLLAGTCQPEDGSCVYAFAPATHVCRAANGACDSEELCTGASGECPADTKFGAARVCRSAAAGGCDVAETCDGASDECPADAFQPASHVCRSSAGACDPAEQCNGADAQCPGDQLSDASVICRAAAPGGCDVAEHCGGGSVDCPADNFAPANTLCRAAAEGSCDVAERCTGSSASCPSDAVLAVGDPCRASKGICDLAESCNGVDKSCPADAKQPAETPCPDDGNPCTVDECTGSADGCEHSNLPDGTSCDTDSRCLSGACMPYFYGWSTAAFGACTSTCGTGTQSRGVTCQRSDGATVDDSRCDGSSRPAASQGCADYSTCTFSWMTGSYGACVPACGTSTQSRSVWCERSDGTPVAEENCTAAKPAVSTACTDFGACTFSWQASNFGVCSTGCGIGSQSRTITCVRSDGLASADEQCTEPKPATSGSCTDFTGCTFAWKTGSFGSCVAACGSSTQSRSVWCERSDGATVEGTLCGGGEPAATASCTDYSTCTYSWQTSAYGSCAAACGSSTQSRSVWCQRSDGATVEGTFCGGGQPASSASCDDYSTCSYTWMTDPFGACSTSCGSGTQSRTVYCRRSDGTTVGDASCNAGAKPATSQACSDVSSCTFSWQSGAYGSCSTTCGSGTQSRTVSCQRSDGATVADASCDAGAKPAVSQACTDVSSCTYQWMTNDYGACSTSCGSGNQTRTVYCRRSDGVTVADASCDAGAKPATSQSCTDISSCTYSWVTGDYGACSTTCGSGNQTRTVSCRRSDGATVADASCDAGAKPAASRDCSDVSTCTYGWQSGAYGACSTTCGSGTKSRTVTCVRSDGASVGDASCDAGSKPATSDTCSDTSTCTYSWQAGAYGACSTTCGSGTKNRSVTCVRSDGVSVGDASCDAGSKPATSDSCSDTSTCTYAWETGAWGGCSTTCGTGSQTRSLVCRRSDGAIVAGGNCTSSAPATSQSCSEYGGCTYSWVTGDWGNCLSPDGCAGTQSRSVYCQRSDGGDGGSMCSNLGLQQPESTQACTAQDGNFCSGGTCCLGACIDMNWDTQNCGACGNVCPSWALCCELGVCSAGPCR